MGLLAPGRAGAERAGWATQLQLGVAWPGAAGATLSPRPLACQVQPGPANEVRKRQLTPARPRASSDAGIFPDVAHALASGEGNGLVGDWGSQVEKDDFAGQGLKGAAAPASGSSSSGTSTLRPSGPWRIQRARSRLARVLFRLVHELYQGFHHFRNPGRQ